MKEKVFAWKSSDGIKYSTRQWSREGAIKGSLALIHGLGEHSGRYEHVASSLTEEGLVIMALDLQGHGETGGKRGHILSYSSLLHGIHQLLNRLQEERPQRPLFLYGHSLGGNLVLNYALTYPKRLTGVIATSPWLKLAFSPPPLKVFLGRMMNAIYPSFAQSNQIEEGALSHSKDVEERYREDPLVHNQISARLFSQAYERGLWALENANSFETPLLLLHGTGDRITSWKASQLFSQRAKECAFTAWENFYHELHNEQEKEKVLASIRSWIHSQIESHPFTTKGSSTNDQKAEYH